MAFCCGSPPVPSQFKSSADPQVILDNDKFSRDLYKRITTFVSPTIVERDAEEATVNLSFQVPAARRPSSGGLVKRQSIAIHPGAKLQWTESRRLLETQLEQIQEGSRTNWADDLMNQEQGLESRLTKLKLDMYVMEGDGNCQFRSVSFGLYGTQDHHLYVRKKAVDYMRAHRDDFEAYLGEDFDSYLRGMTQSRTWGDELTLRATCEAYGVLINVITSDPQHWFLRYVPQTIQLPNKEIFLTYIAPVHYNAIKRRSRSGVIQQSFSMQRRRSSKIMDALDRFDLMQGMLAEEPHAQPVLS